MLPLRGIYAGTGKAMPPKAYRRPLRLPGKAAIMEPTELCKEGFAMLTAQRYPHVFSPIQIGPVRLKKPAS